MNAVSEMCLERSKNYDSQSNSTRYGTSSARGRRQRAARPGNSGSKRHAADSTIGQRRPRVDGDHAADERKWNKAVKEAPVRRNAEKSTMASVTSVMKEGGGAQFIRGIRRSGCEGRTARCRDIHAFSGRGDIGVGRGVTVEIRTISVEYARRYISGG